MAENQSVNSISDEYLMGLFNGVALVIDDCIDSENETDGITEILDQLRKKYIPFITETELPHKEKRKHYIGISFVILDWNLQSTIREEGATIPDNAKEKMYEENISFIKEMKSQCYCPIFIFTNDEPDDVANILSNAKIPFDEKSNVFIKRKNELIGEEYPVIREIVEWIKSNPSMYVLKKWDIEYQKAKSRLFEGFQNYSPNWPSILWDTFHEDGENESLGIRELLSNNLYSRMKPFSFEERIIKGCYPSVNEDEENEDEENELKKYKDEENEDEENEDEENEDEENEDEENELKKYKDEIRSILEAERFITKSLLDNDDIGTGDLFFDDTCPQKKYYLNIRPQCDIARQKNPELYCLRGRIAKDLISSDGHFLEKTSNAIVPFLNNGKIIEFLFKDIKIIKWNQIKGKRIGRLLPPFITNVQQRYALYLQRQGLPRIPDLLFPPQQNTPDNLSFQDKSDNTTSQDTSEC